MGWSWLLYFCQSVLSKMASDINLCGEAGLFKERCALPKVLLGYPATGVYVDNFNVVAANAGDADLAMDASATA
eukprot:10719854-Karenia_brevis.AAC.1